nr:immunoglobulin light chain junction region [Macaca mulatta]MOV76753.1 immunoglobulin light chain junction region [Macaca mulatta]
CQQRNSYPSF